MLVSSPLYRKFDSNQEIHSQTQWYSEVGHNAHFSPTKDREQVTPLSNDLQKPTAEKGSHESYRHRPVTFRETNKKRQRLKRRR